MKWRGLALLVAALLGGGLLASTAQLPAEAQPVAVIEPIPPLAGDGGS